MIENSIVKVGEYTTDGFYFGNIPRDGFKRALWGVKVGDAVVGSFSREVARIAAKLVRARIEIANMTEEEIRYAFRKLSENWVKFDYGYAFYSETVPAALDTPAEKRLWVVPNVSVAKFRAERKGAIRVSRGFAERYAKAQGFKIINY